MRIGYACLALGVPGSELKSCTQRNADAQRLTALIEGNLKAFERLVDYNLENDIRLFRISSDLIPFGSSPVNSLDWTALFSEDFSRIGAKIRAGGMRVSMHPGQYTVLSAPDEGVAARSVEDLRYHARILDALGTGSDSKIILHLGGVYGDKPAALERFEARFQALDPAIRRRIALENDERCYAIEDVVKTGLRLHAPVIFDNLHHEVNPSYPFSPSDWIAVCRETWKVEDGPQKIHYSQQDPTKKPGSHSTSIDVAKLLESLRDTGRDDLDIMLEVKDKNLSAIKCHLCADRSIDPRALEREWARYKYTMLEHSQAAYLEIRALFRAGNPAPLQFYTLVERARTMPVAPGEAANAAQHVWGYFKDRASASEKRAFETALSRFLAGRGTLSAVKRKLQSLAVQYGVRFLQESYYFWL